MQRVPHHAAVVENQAVPNARRQTDLIRMVPRLTVDRPKVAVFARFNSAGSSIEMQAARAARQMRSDPTGNPGAHTSPWLFRLIYVPR